MERSGELVQLVQDWFDAASRGDTSLVDRHVSESGSVRLIGSDPDEWIRGGAEVARFLRGEVEGAGGDVRFSPSETEAFESGGVGWAATKLTVALPDGRRVSPRWSAVFELNDGVWRFVQTHASMGVGNDEIGWTYE